MRASLFPILVLGAVAIVADVIPFDLENFGGPIKMIDCNGNFPENPTPNDPVRGFIAIYPALSSSSPDISTFAVRLELTSSACLTIPGGNIDDGVIPVVQPCISPPVNRQLFHLLSDDNANTARILWDEQDKCLTDLGNGTVVFQSCENAQGSVFVIEFGIV